jgi:predicted enzyme related to lactoylglutathione lyase
MLREVGEPCWFNILTPDPAAARAFFGALLGWTFADSGLGPLVEVRGHAIGALHDLHDPRTPAGTPPLLGLMLKIGNADATAAQVRALGGRALAPFDIGGAGRLAVCHDPDGAEFDAWQAGSLQGTDVDAEVVGAPTWFEVITTDLDRAAAFYGRLLGWTTRAVGAAEVTFEHRSRPVAGARLEPGPGAQPRWVTYFAVVDTTETVRRATALGAEVFASVATVRGTPAAGLRSPQGVPFHVMQRRRRSPGAAA